MARPVEETTITGRHRIRTATFAPRLEHNRRKKEEDTTMKKFGFATVVASGLVAAILGLAAPAQAVAAADAPTVLASANNIPTGIDHHSWLDVIGPNVNVPHVDMSVHQSR